MIAHFQNRQLTPGGRPAIPFEEFGKKPESLSGVPYSANEELQILGKSVRNIFNTIQEKIDEETEKAVLYHRGNENDDLSNDTEVKRAATGGILQILKNNGVKVHIVDDTKEVHDKADRQEYVKKINDKFNEELDNLTDKNADSKILDVGTPSGILLSVGIPDREIVLYGNKIVKKAKKHGFTLAVIKNLPEAIQQPLSIFKGSYDGSYALLSEMEIGGKKALVSIDVKKGEIQDFNLITSVFGKREKGIINWINNGRLLYTDKKKVLDYISSSAPIADATYNQELSSAAKVVKDFNNPSIMDKKIQKQLVFHGSGKDFDSFDFSHMSEGGGAQAYGWGIKQQSGDCK